MELRKYTGILWRGKWLIILFTGITASSTFIVSRLVTPVYEASTLLLINQAPDSQTSEYTAILTSERLARTYAEMFLTRPVLEETSERLDLEMDAEIFEDLKKAIEVRQIRDTQLIELSIENISPIQATHFANTLVEVFIYQNEEREFSRFAASKDSLRTQLDKLTEQIVMTEESIAGLGTPISESKKSELGRLQADLTQYQGSYTNLLQSYEELRVDEARNVSNVVQVEPATFPLKPVRPKVLLNTVMAAMFGLMIAVVAIFLLEYMDDTIKTSEDVVNRLKVPVLGYLAESRDLNKLVQGPITISEHPLSPLAEAFRSLRKNIAFANGDTNPKVIMVVSLGVQEGKTTIATNLAVSIALSGKRVILVDADLRRPQVHRMLRISNEVGLSDVLQNHRKITDVAHHWKDSHLAVITGGSLLQNPTEVLDSGKMVQVLASLRDAADTVVIDSSPFFISDAWSLADKVDRLLVVIASGRTREKEAAALIEQLKLAGVEKFCVVLNRVPIDQANAYGGYQYYSSYGQEERA